MRRKLVDIKSLRLTHHPVIKTLTQDDVLTQYPLEMLDILSTQTLQCLIEQIVLPVVIDETSNDESYLLLKPEPVFEMLRKRSVVQTMKIQLLIYETEATEAVINTLLFEQTSLNYLNASEHWQNLHPRWKLRKQQDTEITPQNVLAKLADRKPAALRKKQVNHGI